MPIAIAAGRRCNLGCLPTFSDGIEFDQAPDAGMADPGEREVAIPVKIVAVPVNRMIAYSPREPLSTSRAGKR